jgi:hypothetical protein
MAKFGGHLGYWQSALLLSIFFLICLGLGYPTLNRYYSPQILGISDSGQYHIMVETGVKDAKEPWRYRVLVPYLAKPVYWLVKKCAGSWDAVSLALLVINSVFVAASAYLLIVLTLKIINDYIVGLLSALFYLLNFNIANLQLSGLVDSAEGCLIMAVILALVSGRWALLLPLGIIGGLAKETFMLLGGSLGLGYWLGAPATKNRRIIQFAWLASMGLAGLVTVIFIQSIINGHLVLPWTKLGNFRGSDNFLYSVVLCLTDKNFWYVFIWLLPLGLIKLKYLPRPLIYACLGSAAMALILGGWTDARGNLSRPLFETIGPILTISLAYFLASLIKTESHA